MAKKIRPHLFLVLHLAATIFYASESSVEMLRRVRYVVKNVVDLLQLNSRISTISLQSSTRWVSQAAGRSLLYTDMFIWTNSYSRGCTEITQTSWEIRGDINLEAVILLKSIPTLHLSSSHT
ncbi:hypothetical protein H4582DRAFT_295505 [Lactarius indigo]|nr:hypothetical protein H4582DRAFT_295505 [Lactarius indigo]